MWCTKKHRIARKWRLKVVYKHAHSSFLNLPRCFSIKSTYWPLWVLCVSGLRSVSDYKPLLVSIFKQCETFWCSLNSQVTWDFLVYWNNILVKQKGSIIPCAYWLRPLIPIDDTNVSTSSPLHCLFEVLSTLGLMCKSSWFCR